MRLLTSGAPAVTSPPATRTRSLSAQRLAWLGQTVASICWIVSVFAYGISSAGDWLQLAAATSWLTANVATLVADRE
ncbi:MAG: hypothetical protein AAF531_19570 [Actinomycetota bacterium]